VGWRMMRVFGFECDHPSQCQAGYEVLPIGGFWAAVREIREVGWQMRRLRRGMTFYCPNHREDRDGGTDGDQEQTAGQFETAAPAAAGAAPVARAGTAQQGQGPAASGSGAAG
jgi:hypothetical protein